MATLEGLHPVLMRPRVQALLDDPEAKKRGVYIVSGFPVRRCHTLMGHWR